MISTEAAGNPAHSQAKQNGGQDKRKLVSRKTQDREESFPACRSLPAGMTDRSQCGGAAQDP